jgi:hypothetical protein
MELMLRVGDKVPMKGRNITVTPKAAEWLPRIRAQLIEVAQAGGTITYGGLKADVGMPHPTNGLGRLLDLLSEDCFRRKEPSLASLVVNGSTGEVGSDFDGDAATERVLVYKRWR